MEHPRALQIFPFSFISRSFVCLSLLPHLYLLSSQEHIFQIPNWKSLLFCHLNKASSCHHTVSLAPFISIFMNIIRHFFMLPLMCIFLSGLQVLQEPLFSSSSCHLSLAQHTAGVQKLLIAWMNGALLFSIYLLLIGYGRKT